MEKEGKNIWLKCLSLIQKQVLPEKFKTLFEPIRAVRFKDDVLTIQVASAYVYEVLEGEYIDILKSALKAVIGPNAKLAYSVVVERSKPSEPLTTTLASNPVRKPASSTVYLDQTGHSTLKNPFERASNQIQIDSQLNPSYTMESYIEGNCNRLARSAGMAIAQKPGGTAFNPLLIYGGSGLGKTHLAQAIGLEVKQNFPNKVVLYVSTNIFQTQFTEAVRRNEVNDFLHFYQLIDVLILDDIQELAGKTGTQNTFFHIFNHLHQSGKQLILTCDKAPAELEGMEDRLLSRFRWGLSAEIKAPDFDTRKELTVDKIQEVVCEHFNIPSELLQTKTRKREVVQARQLAMYFCKNYTKYSLSYIGSQIGKKDHATVLYACKAVTDLIETDRNFKIQVEEIQRKLYCRN